MALSDINELRDGWIHDPEIMPYHDKSVSVKEYIQTEFDIREFNLLFNDEEEIRYKVYPYIQDYVILQYLRNKYNSGDSECLTGLDLELLKEDFTNEMKIILDLTVFLNDTHIDETC